MAQGKQQVIQLKRVRLSFPQIWEPTAMNPGDKPACSAHFIMAPDSEAAKLVKSTMLQVAESAWGSNGRATLEQLIQQDRVCLRKGDQKTGQDGQVMEGYAGNLFMSARSYVRPTVIDRDKSPLTEQDGKPYAGCYVNAIVAIWPQAGGQYGKRVNAQLQGIQFVDDGDSFGGGQPASVDAFETLGDEFGSGAADEGSDDLI